MYKWMEKAVEERSWEMVREAEEENKQLFDEFNNILQELKISIPTLDTNTLRRLEELFVQKHLFAKEAYIKGFKEAIDMR